MPAAQPIRDICISEICEFIQAEITNNPDDYHIPQIDVLLRNADFVDIQTDANYIAIVNEETEERKANYDSVSRKLEMRFYLLSGATGDKNADSEGANAMLADAEMLIFRASKYAPVKSIITQMSDIREPTIYPASGQSNHIGASVVFDFTINTKTGNPGLSV